jgi:hypothetical protein
VERGGLIKPGELGSGFRWPLLGLGQARDRRDSSAAKYPVKYKSLFPYVITYLNKI